MLDKHQDGGLLFSYIIGQSFIYSKNDEIWSAKRKACAHAFYKERLISMLDTLRVKLIETFAKWQEGIDSNSEKYFDINMATEFSDVLARNIIEISFGEDLSDQPITL